MTVNSVGWLSAEWRAFWRTSLRQWQVIRRYPDTFIATLLWPVLLPWVYLFEAEAFGGGSAAAQAAFESHSGTTQIAAFLYVGWAIHGWLTMILWGPGTALREEQLRGSLESTFLAPVSRVTLLFGTMPPYLGLAMVMLGAVCLSLWVVFGVAFGPAALLRAVVVLIGSAPVLFGIGGMLSAATISLQDASGLVEAVRGTFTVFCGLTYPIVILPDWAEAVARALPPTYVIANLRTALLVSARVSASMSAAELLLVGVMLSAVAVGLFRLTERRARRTGQLGVY